MDCLAGFFYWYIDVYVSDMAASLGIFIESVPIRERSGRYELLWSDLYTLRFIIGCTLVSGAVYGINGCLWGSKYKRLYKDY